METIEIAHLHIEIKNKNPVELADLSLSFLSLAKQYQRFVNKSDLALTKEQAKLVIHEIKPGSIIADLYPFVLVSAGVVLNAPESIESIKSVLEFAKYLKGIFDSLLKGGKLPENVTVRDLKDAANSLSVVANNIGSSYQIHAEEGSTVQVTINLSSTEANAIQNRIVKELEEMKEPEKRHESKVLMYWHTASRGTSGDRAVIESVSENPLPVYIEDESEKIKMLQGRDNPFLVGFVVDVDLLFVREKLRGYKITKLYEELLDQPPATPLLSGPSGGASMPETA